MTPNDLRIDEPTGDDWKDLRKMLDMGPLTTERERVRQAIVAIGLLRAERDAAQDEWNDEQYDKCRDKLIAAGAADSFDGYSVSVLSECLGQIIAERDAARAALVVPIPEEGRWAYETNCAVQGVSPCWTVLSLSQQVKWSAAALACKNRREVA